MIEKLRALPLFPIGLGLLGAGLVLLRTHPHGVGVGHDSIYYISLAHNLAAGEGFTEFDGSGKAASVWPPLFAALLAVLGLTGADPLESARYFNAIAFGLVVFIGSLWLSRLVETRLALFLGSVAIVFSMSLVLTASFVWTETLFNLLALCSLLKLQEFLESQKLSSLVWAAALAALSSLTRYMGVSVIVTGLLLLTLHLAFRNRGKALSEKCVLLVTYSIIAMTPLSLWLVRNIVETGRITGPRGVARRSLTENVVEAAVRLGDWVVPLKGLARRLEWTVSDILAVKVAGVTLETLAAILIGVTVVASGAVLAYVLVSRGKHWLKRAPELVASPYITLSMFVVVYVGLLLWALSRVNVATFADRYVSAIYVPLAILTAVALERLWKSYHPHFPAKRAILVIGIIGFCVVFFTHTIRSNVLAVNQSFDTGMGHASVRWRNSDLVQYLQAQPLDGQLYSNAAEVVYFFGDDPTGNVYRLYDINEVVETNQQGYAADGPTYLIWVQESTYQYNYDRESLALLSESGALEQLFEGEDGVIYRVSLD